MKQKISTILLSGLALVFLSSFVIMLNPQDPPKKQKQERHIKMVKVDDKGKKTELDTVITGNAPFVWQGDTVGGKEFKWVTKNDFPFDSVREFEYKIQDDGKGMFFIQKDGNDCEDFMMPPVPDVPHAPRMMMFGSKKKNVIDLSDPGIISYDKKLRKDGTEKITIVRKQVSEDEQIEENVFFHAPVPPVPPMHPGHTKTVKVIKSDDGKVQVIENNAVIDVKSENGKAKFISEDGKEIRIVEKKGNADKKVEVDVEVNDKKENK